MNTQQKTYWSPRIRQNRALVQTLTETLGSDYGSISAGLLADVLCYPEDRMEDAEVRLLSGILLMGMVHPVNEETNEWFWLCGIDKRPESTMPVEEHERLFDKILFPFIAWEQLDDDTIRMRPIDGNISPDFNNCTSEYYVIVFQDQNDAKKFTKNLGEYARKIPDPKEENAIRKRRMQTKMLKLGLSEKKAASVGFPQLKRPAVQKPMRQVFTGDLDNYAANEHRRARSAKDKNVKSRGKFEKNIRKLAAKAEKSELSELKKERMNQASIVRQLLEPTANDYPVGSSESDDAEESEIKVASGPEGLLKIKIDNED